MTREPNAAGTPDILGAPYTVETIELPDDTEGPVVATLVRRPADASAGQPAAARRGAVLHVHGFADYFFQTAYAEWWTGQGYDFYALDLRKYGRSILPHQTPNYVEDLREYFTELDEAWSRITDRDGHERVILSAHSTGGLVVPLWAHDRQVPATAMVLNSPWFELRGPFWLRTVGTQIVNRVGARTPRRVIPRPVNGFYTRSLHKDHDGEWEFNLEWKPLYSWPVYAGWLRAIRRGHAALHRGLSLPYPALVLTSGATAAPTVMGDEVHLSDIVLDVRQIHRWTPALGSKHLTVVAIDGARHDVTLSLPPARKQVYLELERWPTTYVDA